MRRAPQVLRTTWWAARATRQVRRVLAHRGGVSAPVPAPPAVPAQAVRGVRWGLRIERATCLERSLVHQRWLLAHGQARAVLIGVAHGDRGEVLAHAWLEGEEAANDRHYEVLDRVPAGDR